MAYRGRLLVQLESKLGEEIEKELEVMKPDELIRVQVEKISLFQTAERNYTFCYYINAHEILGELCAKT